MIKSVVNTKNSCSKRDSRDNFLNQCYPLNSSPSSLLNDSKNVLKGSIFRRRHRCDCFSSHDRYHRRVGHPYWLNKKIQQLQQQQKKRGQKIEAKRNERLLTLQSRDRERLISANNRQQQEHHQEQQQEVSQQVKKQHQQQVITNKNKAESLPLAMAAKKAPIMVTAKVAGANKDPPQNDNSKSMKDNDIVEHQNSGKKRKEDMHTSLFVRTTTCALYKYDFQIQEHSGSNCLCFCGFCTFTPVEKTNQKNHISSNDKKLHSNNLNRCDENTNSNSHICTKIKVPLAEKFDRSTNTCMVNHFSGGRGDDEFFDDNNNSNSKNTATTTASYYNNNNGDCNHGGFKRIKNHFSFSLSSSSSHLS